MTQQEVSRQKYRPMYTYVGMLSENQVKQRKKTENLFFNHPITVDTKGFKCGDKSLTIQEFSVCAANAIDTIHFLSTAQFNNLSKIEKKPIIGYLHFSARAWFGRR